MNEIRPDREPAARHAVTFAGNTYDLTALVALITGALLLFMLLTCGMGTYCLPLVPIVAGVIALASASRAADPDRTRLYSWLGIGAGSLAVLLIVGVIVLYVALILVGGALASQ
jgi:hypothetical protein